MAEKPSSEWVKANYPGYAGWNDPASIVADYMATGGSGKEGAGGAAPGGGAGVPTMQDFSGIVSQAQKMYQEAAAPQAAALEAQKPSIEQRYKDLVADITQTGREAKTAEFARRGIPISSGMMEQQLGQQLAGPIAQAGQARGGELQNLTMALANLQAGGQTGAIQTALSMLGMQTGAQQSAAELAMRQWAEQEATRRAGMVTPAQQLAQQQFEWQQPYEERMYEYQLGKPYYKPEAAAPTPTPFPTFGGAGLYGWGQGVEPWSPR